MAGNVEHKDCQNGVREKHAYLMASWAEVEQVAWTRRMPLDFDYVTLERERFTWDINN